MEKLGEYLLVKYIDGVVKKKKTVNLKEILTDCPNFPHDRVTPKNIAEPL